MSVHRKNGNWTVRWREDGQQRARSFKTKREAEHFDRSQRAHSYKVFRLLGPLLDQAQKEQKAGVSVDLRIYARRKPNGDLWGEIAFLDRSGRIATLEGESTTTTALPLAKPEDVQQYLADITGRLFEAVEDR